MIINVFKPLISIMLFLFISTSALTQEARKVAVFDPAGTVDNVLFEIVREEISSVVVNTKGYAVLERQLINKVLEENRFQESGLVNEGQVSDIGKRMGADYVFVTTISTLGENYYISCKMIEVATARIDKQYTGTSTDGINDVPQTTQYIVRRLFGENVQQQVANRQFQQNDRSVQATENQRDVAVVSRQSNIPETYSYGRLTTNGKNVYSSDKLLSNDEVNNLMANTDALQYYNKGIKRRKTGNILMISGASALIAGTILTFALPIETYYYRHTVNNVVVESDSQTQLNYGYMASGGLVGLGCIIPGFILVSKSKQTIQQAVDVYNSGVYGYSKPQPSFEIDFGITSSGGIGLVMRF